MHSAAFPDPVPRCLPVPFPPLALPLPLPLALQEEGVEYESRDVTELAQALVALVGGACVPSQPGGQPAAPGTAPLLAWQVPAWGGAGRGGTPSRCTPLTALLPVRVPAPPPPPLVQVRELGEQRPSSYVLDVFRGSMAQAVGGWVGGALGSARGCG